AKFNAGGFPIGLVQTFTALGGPTVYIDATAMTLGDPLSDRTFITGNLYLSNYGMPGRFGVFAAYVNGATLVMNWSKVYDIPALASPLIATDIIQNPSNGNIYVVGHGAQRALVFTAVGATGALVPGETFSYDIAGGGASDERIYSIDKTLTANNFVVAGTTDITGGSVLAFRINLPGGGVTAQANIPYSAPLSGMRAHDVRSWQNTMTGRQEFFIAATGSPGLLGGFGDLVVLKRDLNLGPIEEYSYGTTGNETGLRVLPNASFGMTVAGTTDPGLFGQGDIIVTKAYRNGVLDPSCKHKRIVPPFTGVTLTKYVESPVESDPLPTEHELVLHQLDKTATAVLCPEVMSVAGGVNAMVLPGEGESQYDEVGALKSTGTLAAMPFPNPLPTGQMVLNLPINSPIDQMMRVSIMDLTGRVVMRRSIAVSEGISLQPLALPALPPGIYALDLLGEGSDGVQVRFAVE
ncbi:MAG TPA: T9SS type A sorting domain-containing protein, partial [Flavobacteriales bacterium]|nr:T9SS type A sorting domain-containing protein [Flavobacteriales bacterium]